MVNRHGSRGGLGGALAPPKNSSAPPSAPPLKNMYDVTKSHIKLFLKELHNRNYEVYFLNIYIVYINTFI